MGGVPLRGRTSANSKDACHGTRRGTKLAPPLTCGFAEPAAQDPAAGEKLLGGWDNRTGGRPSTR